MLIIALALVLPSLAHSRVFTSADGTESLEAKVLHYDERGGTVTFRLENGRNRVDPLSNLSQDDLQYLIDQKKNQQIRSSLLVKMKEDSKREKNKRGQLLYKVKATNTSFEIKNSGPHTLQDLQLNYWVLIQRDNQGNESPQVVKGSEKIKVLEANSVTRVKGLEFKLNQSAISVCTTGCPKVAARAAMVGRDRCLGAKYELLDAQGEVLHGDFTSSRVKKYFTKLAENSR